MRMTLKKELWNSVFGEISLYLSEGESPNVCCFLEIGFVLELTKLEISVVLMVNEIQNVMYQKIRPKTNIVSEIMLCRQALLPYQETLRSLQNSDSTDQQVKTFLYYA